MRRQKPDVEREGDLARLIAGVREGDENAKEELYLRVRAGVRYLIARQLGPQESDDKVHDIFVVVLKAIYDGKLLNAESLSSYTRSVMKRQIASAIRDCVKVRSREASADLRTIPGGRSPEEHTANREAAETMQRLLLELNPKQREILTRYYVLGEPEERICDAMGLTTTQFRQAKWRAKGRFAVLLRDSHALPSLPDKIMASPSSAGQPVN